VEDDLDAFLEATEAAVVRGGYEAVFCSEDAQALALSFGRDRLSATVPYPPHEDVLRAFDKLELSRAALRVGMPTPATVLAEEHAIVETGLPVMVKSRLHWTPGSSGAPARLEAEVCTDREAIRRRVDVIRRHSGEAVLQEVITGRLVHYLVIVDGSNEILGGVQTLAEPLFYPGPDVGQRVRSVSVAVDEELEAKTGSLMKDLRWVGMASLNLLLPAHGGEPSLVDFNGRYGASFDQYIAAGSNFPAIWAALATGRPVPSISPPTAGVRFQWLEGDLRRAVNQRRGGLTHDILDCFSYGRGAVHTLWRRDDPLPTVRFVTRLARRAWSKLHSKMIRNLRIGNPKDS
jgi:predicted ATP-grasp superfamily ATP-dependent carboligase